MKIEHITARWILDSRGTPTVEAEVWCDSVNMGRAAVPSGASTGSHEAHELRDGGKSFAGKGVLKAIDNIRDVIHGHLRGMMADDQYLLDTTLNELDGTPTKERLGANAILAVSLAAAHAAARVRGVLLYNHINDIAHNPQMSIPMPMLNVLNGGRHASRSSDFQEFMLVPVGADNYAHALQMCMEIFAALRKLAKENGLSTAVGDEGGFTREVASNTEMLDILSNAVTTAGYTPSEVKFALDVASSEFYESKKYHLETEKRDLTSTAMIGYLSEIAEKYPVISIEDGLQEDDWSGWSKLTEKLGGQMQLVGDDFLVTNPQRLKRAIDEKAANSILIKPNQIGTLTETIRTIALAKQNGWRTIVSHRSGETEDVTISHLAIGTGAGQIKTGSVSRSDRTAKHNEILRIEELEKGLPFSNPFQ